MKVDAVVCIILKCTYAHTQDNIFHMTDMRINVITMIRECFYSSKPLCLYCS